MQQNQTRPTAAKMMPAVWRTAWTRPPLTPLISGNSESRRSTVGAMTVNKQQQKVMVQKPQAFLQQGSMLSCLRVLASIWGMCR